jgi:TorA maturation chaperone TorD
MAENDQDKARAKADFCRFLAACYYEPGSEFAEERLFDSMREAAARISPHLASRADGLAEAFAAADLKDLLVDYTRLFLGPMEILAKPYGSVWLTNEKTLMQDSTMSLLDLYAEGGFEMDEGFRELPDHVAAELEFLYLMLFRENEAQHSSEPDSFAKAAGLKRRLLDQHLGRWIGLFSAAVGEHAESDFYRRLGETTAYFVGVTAGERHGG